MTEQKTNDACRASALERHVGHDLTMPDFLRNQRNLLAEKDAEIERLRDELQLAADTARYACDGWNDALMHEGAHMAAKAIEAKMVPNA